MQLLPRRYPDYSSFMPAGQQEQRPSHLELMDRQEPLDSPMPQQWPGSERIAIFIDGANLFHAAMHLNIEIDYAKLLHYLTRYRQLFRAYFYTGVDPHNQKQLGFLHWLRRHGFRVVTKEVIHLPDGSKKANLDVKIAVDMLALGRYCTTVVLVSGDGDLAYALDAISYQGVRTEVISLRSMASESLIDVADTFVDLAQMYPEIQR
jgi:uncharacterized LabA/DUF88 family protein